MINSERILHLRGRIVITTDLDKYRFHPRSQISAVIFLEENNLRIHILSRYEKEMNYFYFGSF